MTRILQRGEGIPDGVAYLPASESTLLWGRLFGEGDLPAAEVDSGGTLIVDTLSHEGVMEDQGRDPLGYFRGQGIPDQHVLRDLVEFAASSAEHSFEHDGPHLVTGPVRVSGARPGDLLAIHVLDAVPRVPYGVISNRHGLGALPLEYPLEGDLYSVFAQVEQVDGKSFGSIPVAPRSDRRARFELHPFLGIMGVAPAGATRAHSVPPGPHGGNIDINMLAAGSTLYLPVQVDGALAYFGDPHFAQGDGEVSLTAMEASLRVTARFEVIRREDAVERFGELAGPLVETSDFLVPTGMDPDLDIALQNCVRAAIALLVAAYGMDQRHAYAYLSAATDFTISQVVDLVKGVHARIRKNDFA
ncbi:acetamidase/formamidase family protein [Naasia lichenicola]|uniref:Acetamidase n=1 Tax=Naasia lichenicola TaxID=2565933 RepID=A0A4S4FIJ8_9MICO|nr:acetamidase/formamidase family protein [Naasia lichenicola]THG30079.1 acetamidase [Naasia lichenicola]